MGRSSFTACGAILLTVLYVGYYLANRATPGNNLDPCCVAGWIGWWDQGRYYESLRALAAGNLDATRHWYPLGYALLAVPFAWLGSHPFFPVDLASLLAAYGAFILFARTVGVGATTAVVIFVLTNWLDGLLFQQWVIPWNSSPSAALIWGLLALSAAHLAGRQRYVLLGIVAAAIPLIRPSDGILSAICLAWIAVADVRSGQLRVGGVARVVMGLALPILPYAALYLAIYGPDPTAYTIQSGRIGLTLHNPVWRAYVLLIEPRQWFFAGQGMLQRMPWLIFGFAGALWAFRRGPALALLSACLIAYCLFFLCYVDLLPTGLWRYYNIHYFKWTWPGFGLLGWLLVRELWQRRRVAWGAFAIVLLLSCIRVTPRLAGPDEAANAVDMPGPMATEANTTMNADLVAADSLGSLPNISVMRAFPFPSGDGVRLIGLKRNFAGDVSLGGIAIPATPPPERRWAERIGFGYPCWLPPRPCRKP